MFLCMIPIVYGQLTECDSPIEPSDIPCSVISTYQFDNECSTNTVNIYDEVPILLDTRNWDNYSDTGRCNITFNYTERGSYLLNSSEGSSATIIVRGVKMEFLRVTIFGIFFLLSLVFIAMMHKYKEDTASMAYGFFAMIFMFLMGSALLFGFQVITSDTVTLPYDINRFIGIVCMVIGVYSAWFSVELYRFRKKEENKDNEKEEFFAQ